MAAVAGTVGMVGAGFLSSFISSNSGNSDRRWYEFYGDVVIFPEVFTDLIDMRLVEEQDRVTFASKRQEGPTRFTPGLGTHKFYYRGGRVAYINFTKKPLNQNNRNQCYYKCFASKFLKELLHDAIRTIFRNDDRTIRAITLDNSRPDGVFAMMREQNCEKPKPYQQKAIDIIMGAYKKTRRKHVSVLISGLRGTRKSYTARLIAKALEKDDPNVIVRFYQDFNPNTPGTSFNYHVGMHVKEYTPGVVCIDEIDVSYANASRVTDKQMRPMPCQPHTTNKTSFNAMLDAIDQTNNLITIFTTELSLQQLYEHPEWHSFMRPGRVNFFLEYTMGSCKIVNHDSIIGYESSDTKDIDFDFDLDSEMGKDAKKETKQDPKKGQKPDKNVSKKVTPKKSYKKAVKN